MRNLAELKAECVKNAIIVTRAGKREAKSDYEQALRNFYWKRDYPGHKMPPQLHPMLARNLKDVDKELADLMWASSRYIAQEKIDGCRLLMFMTETGNMFTSRRISDKTYRYSENTEQVPHLSNLVIPSLAGTVIDGEVVSPKARVDTGKTITLNGLQATVALLALNPVDSARVQRVQDCQLVFKVFDILQHEGKDVTGLPLRHRQQLLLSVVSTIHQNYSSAKIEFVTYTDHSKKEFYEEIVKRGGEGIMLKDMDSTYEASSSRSKAMWKVKRFEELDAFVTNFAPGDVGSGWEKVVGGLEVSCHDETTGALHPVAWVTNLAFEDRVAATVCSQCGQPMIVDWANESGKRVIKSVKCSSHGEQAPALNPRWFNRVYVIRGQEITARVLRLKHAAIISIRHDKDPDTCTIPLAAWRAKFEAKGGETGISL